MTNRAGTAAAAVLITLLGCTYTEQQSAAAPAEVIVKFAAEQPINTKIAQAFEDESAEASIAESVRELSHDFDVPFAYSRLTSGREIVVAIPTRPVLNAIADRLRQSGDVAAFAVDTNGTVLVTVKPTGIKRQELLDPDGLGSRLVGNDQLPVQCEFRSDGKLVIAPDLERLAGLLARDLGRRGDIEYAQPNFQARHFDSKR